MAENTSQGKVPGVQPGKRVEPNRALYAQLRALKKQVEGLSGELVGYKAKAEEDTLLGEITGEEDLDTLKRKLLAANRKIKQGASELSQRETQLSARERALQAKDLAAQFGVDEQELIAAEDMSLRALELYKEKQTPEVIPTNGKQNEPVPAVTENQESRFESGDTLRVTGKTVADMTDAEFKVHVAQQERKALAVK